MVQTLRSQALHISTNRLHAKRRRCNAEKPLEIAAKIDEIRVKLFE